MKTAWVCGCLMAGIDAGLDAVAEMQWWWMAFDAGACLAYLVAAYFAARVDAAWWEWRLPATPKAGETL